MTTTQQGRPRRPRRRPSEFLRAALAAGIALTAAPVAWAQDDAPRTALISAFPPEWRELQKGLDGAQRLTHHGVVFITGRLEGRPVVLFLSGIGMVNATMTAQMALERFAVSRIVFSGIAGGVDPELAIGDVVVPAQWGPYLEGVLARERDGAYSLPPWLAAPAPFPNYGMIFTYPVPLLDVAVDQSTVPFWLPADPELLALARRVAADFSLPACTAAGDCLSRPPRVRIGGHGVSGSFFVDNAEFRTHVHSAFRAQVLDMESAAVAHVAKTNGVPFIAFRSLSDLAGGGEGPNEMDVFMSLAASNSAALVRAFLAALD